MVNQQNTQERAESAVLPQARSLLAPSTLWLRTISGPVIKADRLVSLSVLYADGHHVDFDRTVTWRDEPAYLTAFFDYLEYGMPIGICRVANALISMHTFMDMYTACVTSGRSGVIGAVPNTDPLNWAIDRFLPPLPLQLNPSTQAWNPHSGDIAEMSMNGRHASDGS